MANQIPLSGATDAAGGYLIPEQAVRTLVKGVKDHAGVLPLADVTTTSNRAERYPIFLGEPTAAFVGEGQPKPTTGAEYDVKTLNIKKLATIFPMTDEFRADVAQVAVGGGDPMALVGPRIENAFASLIDAHLLGRQLSGGAIANVASNFDFNLRTGSTHSVEYDASDADGLQRAVSAAMAKIEDTHNPTGIVVGTDANAYIRDARRASDGSADALYLPQSDPFYGLRVSTSKHLNKIGESAAAGKIVAVVGDFSQLVVRVREDLSIEESNQATITIGGSPVNLWENNMTAWRYEMRLGALGADPNAFCVITNAS